MAVRRSPMTIPTMRHRTPYGEGVVAVIRSSLEPNSEVQRVAYEQRKALELVDEYPLVLSDVIAGLSQLEEKHLAAIFLKNYLEEAVLGERDIERLYQKGIMRRVCSNLLDLIDTGFKRVRNMVCCSLSLLCVLNFWDHISTKLFIFLTSPYDDVVNGAVVVLEQLMLTKHYENVPNFELHLGYFDALLNVFKKVEFQPDTRYTTLSPIFTILKSAKDQEFVISCLSHLGETFENALQERIERTPDYIFKTEIIKCLYRCGQHFNNLALPVISPALAYIGQLLSFCCDQFKDTVKNVDNAVPSMGAMSQVSEDDPLLELVIWLLKFLKSLINLPYFDVIIEDLFNIEYSLILFMSCYDNMENHVFLEENEREKLFRHRTMCTEIFVLMVDRIEHHKRKGRELFFKVLMGVCERFVQEIDELKAQFPAYCVRINEAVMHGMGLCGDFFDRETIGFPVNELLNNWTSFVQREPHLMLNGRLLWLGGKYATEIAPHLLEIHIQTIRTNCESDVKYIYPPSAQALANYLINFKDMSIENQMIFCHSAEDLLVALLELANKTIQTPVIGLYTLECFIESQPQIVARKIDVIQAILIRIIYESGSDILITRALNNVVAKLGPLETVRQAIYDNLLRFLVGVIYMNIPPEFKDPASAPEKAVDMLNSFFMYSDLPFSNIIIEIFVGAFRLINKEYPVKMEPYEETAGTLLTTFVVKYGTELKMNRDDKGELLAAYYPKIIELMSLPECFISGRVFSRFTVVCIYSALEIIEPHFEQIIRSVLTADFCDFENIRATWIIFLFICMCRPAHTINYLSSLPGPEGGSALNHLLKLWLPLYNKDTERIERQLMATAITSVIEYCLANEEDFKKISDATVGVELSAEETPNAEEVPLTGVEYLYFMAISLLFFERRLGNEKENRTDEEIYRDEDIERRDDENNVLFANHPFNIDVTAHLVNFLATPSEPYFMVIDKLFGTVDIAELRDCGCAVPEDVPPIGEENME